MKRVDREYRKFVVIEIKNESELNRIMEFDFPFFKQGTNLYLNEAKDRMILKIINFRTFLFDIIPS